MSRITVDIDLNRVEGDLEFQVDLEDGVVVDARCVGTLYRGFANSWGAYGWHQCANALFDWLEDHGTAFGWVREVDPTLLQAAANAGEVCLIVAQRRDLNSPGHITVVVPERDGAVARRNTRGEVVQPLESQAGTRNVLRAPAANAWWLHARFRAHAFWRHP